MTAGDKRQMRTARKHRDSLIRPRPNKMGGGVSLPRLGGHVRTEVVAQRQVRIASLLVLPYLSHITVTFLMAH
jgi:hypothetical protein